jgi:predicted nucleotidyltransferase
MISSKPLYNKDRLASVCQKWGINKVALFGSITTENFTEESDIDVLIDLDQGISIGYLKYHELYTDLQSAFSRKIDLLTRRSVEKSTNIYLRRSILTNAEVIYG